MNQNTVAEWHLSFTDKIMIWLQQVVCIYTQFFLLLSVFQVWRFITRVFSRIVVLRVQERISIQPCSRIASIYSRKNAWFWIFGSEECQDWKLSHSQFIEQFKDFDTFLNALENKEFKYLFRKGFFSYYIKFMSQIRFNSKKQFRVAWMSATALCALSKSFQKSLTWSSDSFGYLKPR